MFGPVQDLVEMALTYRSPYLAVFLAICVLLRLVWDRRRALDSHTR